MTIVKKMHKPMIESMINKYQIKSNSLKSQHQTKR